MKITRDQIPERPKLVAHRVDILEKPYDITLRLKNHVIDVLPFIFFMILSIPVGNFIIGKQTDKYFLIPIIYGLGGLLFFIFYKLEQVTLPEIGFSTLISSQKMHLKIVYVVYPSDLDKTRIVFGLKTFADQYDEGQILLDYFSSDYTEMVALGTWLTTTIGNLPNHSVEFTPTDFQKSDFPVRFVLRFSQKHQKTVNLALLDLAHPKYEEQKIKSHPFKKIY